MLLLFYIIPEWDWCFTYWIYIRVYDETFVAYTNITESSKNITCQGSKSYQDYPLKLRTKGQNKWTKEFFLLFLAWLTFIAFKHILASFSLERRWCSALIGGSRTAPCVAEKTNSGMTWQSLPRSEQMWSVAGLSPWFRAFLVCLFVSACSASVFSNSERPCCTACLQAERSEAKVSHPLISMTKAFRSLLQTSS